MSATHDVRAVTPPGVVLRQQGKPLICLTAYLTPIAKLVDPHCDQEASAAVAEYAKEVRERRFPAAEHVFGDTPKAVAGGDAA
jgi:ketopantoate hydroxymethyltransferase